MPKRAFPAQPTARNAKVGLPVAIVSLSVVIVQQWLNCGTGGDGHSIRFLAYTSTLLGPVCTFLCMLLYVHTVQIQT